MNLTKCYDMAEQIETRWDGITTVVATVMIGVVATSGIVTGRIGTETLLLVVGALSGIGGYSAHNVVRNGGKGK
jgi:hypothetical protein